MLGASGWVVAQVVERRAQTPGRPSVRLRSARPGHELRGTSSPVPEDENIPFSESEWESCLKVLEALCAAPESAPDRERVERLVARIYKKVRKQRRKSTAREVNVHDRALVEQTGRCRAAPRADASAFDEDTGPRLNPVESTPLRGNSRVCYICRSRYRELDAHYHMLCADCARLNIEKRHQRASLKGRRALVTGGRIKVGYESALKLLRDDAEVFVTTRFSRDAAQRYCAESDFDEWSHRLHIYRLDFKYAPGVVAFTDHLMESCDSLDIVVNNAAQTIRRPHSYYAHHEALEAAPLSSLPAPIRRCLTESTGVSSDSPELVSSARPLSEVPTDEYGEPMDARESTSWNLRLAEVSPSELLEALLINTAAPFILTGALRPLLERSSFEDRYVINVTGLDGRFRAGYKSVAHPHVNMSKAALNMMTRTSAVDFAESGIFMNSVDTGWITLEGSHSAKVRLREKGFVPPLDAVDGAARIYDPIVRGLSGHREQGCLFRHYGVVDW